MPKWRRSFAATPDDNSTIRRSPGMRGPLEEEADEHSLSVSLTVRQALEERWVHHAAPRMQQKNTVAGSVAKLEHSQRHHRVREYTSQTGDNECAPTAVYHEMETL